MSTPKYRNKKGKLIEVTVTRHAVLRFKQRYSRAIRIISEEEARQELIDRFNRARPEDMQGRNRQHLERRKKRSPDTLYFCDPPFRFVVQNKVVVTVEVRGKRMRHLNKPKACWLSQYIREGA